MTRSVRARLQRLGDGGGVLRVEQACRAEELDGMREARGDDRLAGGDRLDQDAGGDLLQRFVREQHDIGGAQLAQG